MSLKSLEQGKLLGFLKSIDKELASSNRKHKKLNLLITKLRGAFACALACVRDLSEISSWGGGGLNRGRVTTFRKGRGH